MKHLKTFNIFENETNLSEADDSSESMTGWLYSFFTKLSDRFKKFEDVYTANSMKDHFGNPIDSGFGWLIGTTGSMASEVAAKVFKPSDVFTRNGKGILGSLQTPTKDSEVTAEHQRLMNQDFVQNDLSGIKSENDMSNWVAKQYAKNGLKPGQKSWFDKIMKDDALIWKNGGKLPALAGEAEAAAIGGAEAAAVGGAEAATAGGIAAAAEGGIGIESLAALALL